MKQPRPNALTHGDAPVLANGNGDQYAQQQQHREHIVDDSMVVDTSLSFLDDLDDVNALLDEELFINDKLLPAFPAQHDHVTPQLGDATQQPLTIEAHASLPAAVPAPLPPTAKAATAPTTTARARQKAEIDYLRAQVVELEQELDRIKRSEADTTSDSLKDPKSQPFVWEKIAKSQHEQRQSVEALNIKLRDQLQGQLRVARSLEKLLRKRSAMQVDTLFTENKRARGGSTTDLLSDESVYEEIQMRVSSQFDNVDDVLKACGLANLWTDTDTVQVQSDLATNGIFLEVGLVKVMPFPLEQVAEAVWNCTSTSHWELENERYTGKELSDKVCSLDMTVKLQVRRGKALVRIKGVGSRREEPDKDRVLVVFECLGGVIEGSSLFTGDHVLCREMGYMVMEKAPLPVVPEASNSETGLLLPSTVVKSCIRMWPEMAGSVCSNDSKRATRPPQAGRFADIVVGTYNQHTKTMLQAIENALLAQTHCN